MYICIYIYICMCVYVYIYFLEIPNYYSKVNSLAFIECIYETPLVFKSYLLK